MLKVTIYEYLEKIKVEEERRLSENPEQAAQRHQPSTEELATVSGTSASNYYKWAGNRTTNISRSIPCKIVSYLRSLGFDTQLTDILRCVDAD